MNNKHILSKAITFATQKHDGQFDRGGLPYILHPLRVMSFLKTDDEELMAIAVLHDVVEDAYSNDHEAGFEALKYIGMTDRVVAAVRLLTHKDEDSYDSYIANLMSNHDATKVKMCDLRHNMDLRRLKGIREKDLERMNKYVKTYHFLKNALENKNA
jgi:(p)ppGpp synthase/HD superfamily hydrolase